MKVAQKNKLVVKAMDYQLMVGNLYKLGVDGILRRCVLKHERPMILTEEHDGITGGHYAWNDTTHDIFHVGIWWPILHKDAKEYFHICDVC
jgi:hypothetical protein